MIVSSRYAVLALAILVGGMAALFLWQGDTWYDELQNVPQPVSFNPGPSLMRASASSTERKKESENRCPTSSTMAQDPLSKVCAEFETPCDVPQGWMAGCPIAVPAPVTTPPKRSANPEPVQEAQ